jgi:hypothetical protein
VLGPFEEGVLGDPGVIEPDGGAEDGEAKAEEDVEEDWL